MLQASYADAAMLEPSTDARLHSRSREFGSDLLAGISILSSVLLGQYLVGAMIVLMLSGGAALEQFAIRRASSVLDALANRMPRVAHRSEVLRSRTSTSIRRGSAIRSLSFLTNLARWTASSLRVVASWDKTYLTREPFQISKTPGSTVLSGAINGDVALNPLRFLAVIVIATPRPLILAIPAAVIGAISWAAKHSIIIKNPAASRFRCCAPGEGLLGFVAGHAVQITGRGRQDSGTEGSHCRDGDKAV